MQHHILLEGCFKDKESQEGVQGDHWTDTRRVHKSLGPSEWQVSTFVILDFV